MFQIYSESPLNFYCKSSQNSLLHNSLKRSLEVFFAHFHKLVNRKLENLLTRNLFWALQVELRIMNFWILHFLRKSVLLSQILYFLVDLINLVQWILEKILMLFIFLIQNYLGLLMAKLFWARVDFTQFLVKSTKSFIFYYWLVLLLNVSHWN